MGKPTVDEWVATWPSLRHVGVEHVGPCPLCGGRDRFHLREGQDGRAVVGCRGCIDGQPEALRRARFVELVRFVFPHQDASRPGNGSLSTPKPKTPPRPAQASALTDEQRRNAEYGRRLWREADPIPTPPSTSPPDTSPPRLWLGERSLLHPYQTPPSVIRYHVGKRYIVAALWPIDAIRAAWPAGPAGEPPAVAVCAIDERGSKRYRQPWDGDKRSYGPITETGALLALGDPEVLDEEVHICEGIADALAIYARQSGLVLASITKVNAILNRQGVRTRLAARRVRDWHDRDANHAGQDASERLTQALKEAGIHPIVAALGEHGDPADWSAALGWPLIDAAHFDEEAGKHYETNPPAEADRLAIHALTSKQRGF